MSVKTKVSVPLGSARSVIPPVTLRARPAPAGVPHNPSCMAEERRLVTILFSDVAGSDALREERDPQDLPGVPRPHYRVAQKGGARERRPLREIIWGVGHAG